MSSNINYYIALHIAQKGKYFPQPTNHAGLPTHPVSCDYCGRGGLGGSWKTPDTPHLDLCMQCYVRLQSSNNTSSNNGNSLPMSGNINQEFHSYFTNNQITDYGIPSYWQQNQSSYQSSNQSSNQSSSLDNYHSAWDSDVPGSYSNRIITTNDSWKPK